MQVVAAVARLGLGWHASFAIILSLYYFSHYLFASSEPQPPPA